MEIIKKEVTLYYCPVCNIGYGNKSEAKECLENNHEALTSKHEECEQLIKEYGDSLNKLAEGIEYEFKLLPTAYDLKVEIVLENLIVPDLFINCELVEARTPSKSEKAFQHLVSALAYADATTTFEEYLLRGIRQLNQDDLINYLGGNGLWSPVRTVLKDYDEIYASIMRLKEKREENELFNEWVLRNTIYE